VIAAFSSARGGRLRTWLSTRKRYAYSFGRRLVLLNVMVGLLPTRARIGRESRGSLPATDTIVPYAADRAANRFGGRD